MRTLLFALLPFCLAAQTDTIQWGARAEVMQSNPMPETITVYCDRSAMLVYREIAEKFGLKSSQTIYGMDRCMEIVAANSMYGLERIRAAMDSMRIVGTLESEEMVLIEPEQGRLEISAGSIPFDTGQISISFILEGAEVTGEGIVLHPAPGYRTFWCYWGGRWYDEYTYLRTPGIGCRCMLRYFDNGERNAVWLDNINLPDYRMKRIVELADCDSLMANAHEYRNYNGDWTDFDNLVPTSINFYSPDANGDFPVGNRVNLQFAMERALWAILQSRKK